MYFEQRDLDELANDFERLFNTLPLSAPFYFKWKKGSVRPGGATYTTVFETVPGLALPRVSDDINKTGVGELVVEERKKIAIPKKWGESIYIEGITYSGGIQINDLLTDQNDLGYKVVGKQTRGFGAYYVLDLALEKGYSNAWVESQSFG